MRVLSDMDADPELDMFVMHTQPGDRWLLCSDGLSGVVDEAHILKAMRMGAAPGRTADNLLKQALDGGAPDNVTIVLVDVGGQHAISSGTPTIVGSASNPANITIPAARSTLSNWLHPVRQAANEPSHFEPAPEYLEELIEEDRRRAKRRRLGWIAGMLVVLAMLGVAAFAAYSWTQTRYFIGADDDSVVIFQGVQQNIGPITLSTPLRDTDILLADLPEYQRLSVERTITARSLSDAEAIVARLQAGADAITSQQTQTPLPTPVPTPTEGAG
jgi:protein phosphatase